MDKEKEQEEYHRLWDWKQQNHESTKKVAISSQSIQTPRIETPKLWKGLSDYFNPPTNYQVLAPLWNEDVVTATQAIVVETKKISQTSSERTRQTTQSNSPNIENEEHVHIKNNLNLKTPLLIILAFGTFEWITK